MSNDADKPNMRPFPWKCGHCHERAVFMTVAPYRCDIYHDGFLQIVEVPDLETPRCTKCGGGVMIDAASRRITDTLRRQVGLLMPSEMYERRTQLGLSQEDVARRLGVSEEVYAAWEDGNLLPSRVENRFLQLFFAFPDVRDHLKALQSLEPQLSGS